MHQASILVADLGVRPADLKYSDILGLEKSIDAAYEIASQRLFDVFFDKFKLLDHLLALKHYFLLGYGDFADILMDALAYVFPSPRNLVLKIVSPALTCPAPRTPSTGIISPLHSKLQYGPRTPKKTLRTYYVDSMLV